jgi:glucose-1-phosphate thymidylyltransferase
MKGVILAGGLGTRLHPLTLVTNKHLLPVYDKPMILYPLETLKRSGITDIMVVCGKEHGGAFMNFLGSGKEYGVKFSYALQNGSGGIAEALSLTEDFVGDEDVAVILGDNVFEDDFAASVKKFENLSGAMVFVKKVPDPQRFAVVNMKGDKVESIEEKPKQPRSDLIMVGFYIYSPDAFSKIATLKPSGRGELEITDLNNIYLKEGRLYYDMLNGFWSDAGTFESLYRTAGWVAEKRKAA